MRYCGYLLAGLCMGLLSALAVSGAERKMNVASNQRFVRDIVPLLEQKMNRHAQMVLWNWMGEQYKDWGEQGLSQQYYQKADAVYERLSKTPVDPAELLLNGVFEHWNAKSGPFAMGGMGRDYNRLLEILVRMQDPQQRASEYTSLMKEMLRLGKEEQAVRLYEMYRKQLGDLPEMEFFTALQMRDYDRLQSVPVDEVVWMLEVLLSSRSAVLQEESIPALIVAWQEGQTAPEGDLSKQLRWLLVKAMFNHRSGETAKRDMALQELERLEVPPEMCHLQINQQVFLYLIYHDMGSKEERNAVFDRLMDLLREQSSSEDGGVSSGIMIPLFRICSLGEWEHVEQLVVLALTDPLMAGIAVGYASEEALRQGRLDLVVRWVEQLDELSRKEEVKRIVMGQVMPIDLTSLWIRAGDYPRAFAAWSQVLQQLKDSLRLDVELAVALWMCQQYANDDTYQTILNEWKDRAKKPSLLRRMLGQ